MKSIVAVGLVLGLFATPVYGAEEADVADNLPQEVSVRYTEYNDMPQLKELAAEDDDLYSGSEVKPALRMTEDEKLDAMSSDFDYIEKEYKHPELSCDNPQLTRQTALFIRDHLGQNEGSVTSRRERILLIKNLHNFTEIAESSLDSANFKTKAALMNLRINENRKIYKICESRDNKFGLYNNIYLIIYPYLKYYKVVVTNLIGLPEKMEDATFIYSW